MDDLFELPNQTLRPLTLRGKGACGPGRDGVRGAEQAATTSAAKVHPSPREGGKQAHENEVQRASYDSESLALSRLANDNHFLNGIKAE